MNHIAEQVRVGRRPPPVALELVNRRTPLVLVIEDRPAVSAAIAELCALTEVTQASGLPDAAELVAFLFRAGQSGRCLGLLAV